MSQKARVLVVEDDGDIAEVLRRSLRLDGYEVRLAGDGVQALDKSSLFEPDAVVLDLGLPRLDGIAVCRRLREGGDVPILILTARDGLDARVEGLDSGADHYLVEPFERVELLARLRALQRRRPPRRMRLALISATLTFAILALFAVVIGLFASKQVHSEFDDELNLTAADLQQRLVSPSLTGPIPSRDREALKAAAAGQAVVRIVVPYGVTQMPPASPSLGPPRAGTHNIGKYRVASRPIAGPGGPTIGYLPYGKPTARLNHTTARIDLV